MNKQFFQSIFNQKMGFVYAYKGTVPEGESPAHYITAQFAQAAGSNLVNTVVSELPTFGVTVIYYHSEENNINSANFELITDLVPDPIPEPPVLPEPPAPEETSPEEPSQG
jgi:hypothetical protein